MRKINTLSRALLALCCILWAGCTAQTNDPATDTNVGGTDTNPTDTTMDDTAGMDATDTGGDVELTLCDEYCQHMMQACTGENAQYPDEATCQTTCAGIPVGEPADYSGVNSLHCRLNHLDAADVDPVTHCPHTGEDGADRCFDQNAETCGQYCGNVFENCRDENEIFATIDECLDACNPVYLLGTEGDEDGDSVHCRLTHSMLAAADPETSCPNAVIDDNPVCLPMPCDVYCDLMDAHCTGDNSPFIDRADCLTRCAAYPDDGMDGAAGGDTVQCRIYHATAAQADGATHCPHSGPDGAGVCVD